MLWNRNPQLRPRLLLPSPQPLPEAVVAAPRKKLPRRNRRKRKPPRNQPRRQRSLPRRKQRRPPKSRPRKKARSAVKSYLGRGHLPCKFQPRPARDAAYAFRRLASKFCHSERCEESAVGMQLIRCWQKADSSTALRRFGMTTFGAPSLIILCHSDEPRSGVEESAVLTTRICDGSPQPSARSSQVGFLSSISAIFFSRRHFLISVSRPIASPTFLKLWKYTRQIGRASC